MPLAEQVRTREVHCAACGGLQPLSLFCRRCTAPLAVAPLCEMDDDDLRLATRALLETLSPTLEGKNPPEIEDRGLWDAYLSAFWLRPETALILYGEALALRRLRGIDSGPWLDLGCGDGIHAAIRHGWRFAPEFDCFQCLDLGAPDIYHHWDPSAFRADVVQRGSPIALGADIKSTAVARSRALGVFDQVLEADAAALPLPDRSVRSIFSNMLRDLGEPLPGALRECRRVLADDGVLIISAMTPQYRDSLYFWPAAVRAEQSGDRSLAERLLRLDRGRSVFCQRQLSIEDWEKLLRDSGLRLAGSEPVVGPQAIRFWDAGLRPFSTALLAQRELWTRAGLLGAIKPAACSAMSRLLHALVADPLAGGSPCMMLLAAEKA